MSRAASDGASRHRGRRGEPGGGRAETFSRRTSSIARSIALGTVARRLAAFVAFDALLAVAVTLGVLSHELSFLPDSAHMGPMPANGTTLALEGAWPDLMQARLVARTSDAKSHVFALDAEMSVLAPVACTLVTCQALALACGLLEPRRIRRRLRPLNELALTAEAAASAVGDDARLAQLERAIEQAGVEAPVVSTGNQDLRGIEVALNSLFRRMQEARAQQVRFVSDASHELRTPIAVIQGYVRMLDRWGKDDPDVLEESIAALKAESDHMGQLVEQLLFLARGDSGRQALERAEVDLGELVDEVAAESRMIDEGHVYEATARPVPANADRSMLKQALRAMVQNAARYSAAGATVRLRVTEDPGRARVGLSVEDEGVGIAAGEAARVFDRFYRSPAARAESREGSGLGLAVVKWIADAHGGSVEVLSREGVGTRFTLWLPRG